MENKDLELMPDEAEEDLTENAFDEANETEEKTDSLEEDAAPDYERIVESDLNSLSEAFPELSEIRSISELSDPLRYAALRDLGLTPKEAYLATGGRKKRADNRAHLSSSVPRGAEIPRGAMSEKELNMARDIFSDMSDREIRRLYRRVTQ